MNTKNENNTMNVYKKPDIKKFEYLTDSDYICDHCNGWGWFYNDDGFKVFRCTHCGGEGKLDWISNITGVFDGYMSGLYGTSGLPKIK